MTGRSDRELAGERVRRVLQPAGSGERALPEDAPVISVVIPCRTTAPDGFLAEAVASTLTQTRARVECIIVDDGSAPSVRSQLPPEFLRSIQLVECDIPSGCALARNAGLQRASGEFVIFLDHDDLLEHTALDRLVRASQTSGADVILGLKQNVGPETTAPFRARCVGFPERRVHSVEWIARLCRPDRFGAVVLYNRQALGGLQFRNEFLRSDDLLFTLEAMFGHHAAVLNEVVFGYRQHASSWSTTTSARGPSRTVARRSTSSSTRRTLAEEFGVWCVQGDSCTANRSRPGTLVKASE